MQKLFIAGNVGRDAELRRTSNGDPVLGWSIAVDNGKDKNGNKRDSTWYDCALWGKRAESLAPHIKKGDKLAVEGRPGARTHDGKVYMQISVNELTFMGGGKREDGGGYQEPQGGGYSSPPDDSEIPF